MVWRYALTLISVFLLTVGILGQPGEQYYNHKDYSGGINVQSDSASLQLNQALIMENFIFDRFGSLQKRPGIKYWNSVQFPVTDTVKYIHYFYRNTDDDMLLIGTNTYIYFSSFVDTATFWHTNKVMEYDGGSISYKPHITDSDSNRIYGTGTWWLASIKEGDSLGLPGQRYLIDSILADTLFTVVGDLLDTTIGGLDTTCSGYSIYRTIIGDPYITSWNNAAYIADSESPSFYYADSLPYWLNCVDTGTVDVLNSIDTVQLDTTAVTWFYFGQAEIIDDGIYDSVVTLYTAGENIKLRHYLPQTGYVLSEMIGNIGNNRIRIHPAGSRIPSLDSITNIYNDVFDDTLVTAIVDTNKTWDLDNHAGDILVNGNSASTYHSILYNGYNTLTFDSPDDSAYFAVGDRYYIFEAIPYTEHCNDSLWAPRFKQLYFHNNTLFAYGYEFDKNGDTISTGTIFHSEVGLPKSHIVYYGFDLSLSANDKPTAMFGLNGNLMLSSSSKIYKMMGWPPALVDSDPQSYNGGALVEVVPEMGIPNHCSVVRRNNNVYIGRSDGLYYFDGNTIDKISLLIDPLVRKYGGGGYYAGYFRDNVYFGSNDSDYTFIYYEPTKTFTTNAVGLSLFSNQDIMSDSGYIIFAHDRVDPRRLYKYPVASLYLDSTSSTATDIFAVHYKTGWMDLGDFHNKKLFTSYWIQLTKQYSADTVFVKFRTDFSSTASFIDTITTSVSSSSAYRVITRTKLPSTLKGRFLQMEIIATTYGHVAIGEWEVGWIPVTQNTD